jgi:hypothetical protein
VDFATQRNGSRGREKDIDALVDDILMMSHVLVTIIGLIFFTMETCDSELAQLCHGCCGVGGKPW